MLHPSIPEYLFNQPVNSIVLPDTKRTLVCHIFINKFKIYFFWWTVDDSEAGDSNPWPQYQLGGKAHHHFNDHQHAHHHHRACDIRDANPNGRWHSRSATLPPSGARSEYCYRNIGLIKHADFINDIFNTLSPMNPNNIFIILTPMNINNIFDILSLMNINNISNIFSPMNINNIFNILSPMNINNISNILSPILICILATRLGPPGGNISTFNDNINTLYFSFFLFFDPVFEWSLRNFHKYGCAWITAFSGQIWNNVWLEYGYIQYIKFQRI